MILGITGFIGSGKSTLVKIFDKYYNIFIINTDNIAKSMIKEDSFQYINNNNFLDKNDVEFVKENIHPKAWNIVKENAILNNNKYEYVIIETALPTKPFFEICDKTICVKNDIDIKTELLKNNRDYTEQKIQYILSLQKEYDIYYENCDIIINNNGNKEDLEKKILGLKEEKII